MTDEARAVGTLIACVLGWIAAFSISAKVRPMSKKFKIAIAAALGALLLSLPDLVKLIPSIPPELANVVGAIALAAATAYKLESKKDEEVSK